MSPDIAAKSWMSAAVSVRSMAAESPTAISSKVRLRRTSRSWGKVLVTIVASRLRLSLGSAREVEQSLAWDTSHVSRMVVEDAGAVCPTPASSIDCSCRYLNPHRGPSRQQRVGVRSGPLRGASPTEITTFPFRLHAAKPVAATLLRQLWNTSHALHARKPDETRRDPGTDGTPLEPTAQAGRLGFDPRWRGVERPLQDRRGCWILRSAERAEPLRAEALVRKVVESDGLFEIRVVAVNQFPHFD